MTAKQHVFRVRRNYNRLVANETLEDYALRFTAKSARRWSTAKVSLTALGAISFLALEAIGGSLTLSYGFQNALAAILVVGLVIFLTGLPITYHAAKLGIDIDLLTRGAGFGYIGSTITSLIYATFTFIFFAIEAAILATALELTLGVPLSVGYIISSIVVIPLVTHGISLISRFQVWTQPIWLLLQILPLVFIAIYSDQSISDWLQYAPSEDSKGLDLLAFGAACSVMFSLIAQIGEQVDFLRFLPPQEKRGRWWFAMIAAGPGWIVAGMIKVLIGSFLAVVALSHGVSALQAADPSYMYLTAFGYVTDSLVWVMILTGVFVVLSQLKINVTNAYAGSIAWSNFFSRLTHNHPGRVVWLVFNVGIALLLMELGIYRVLEEILSVYSILALAWVGSMVADLTINRPLGLRPKTMEFKRAHLYDVNPVGVGSMAIASVLGFAAHFHQFGEVAQALSSFVALGSTFICAPLIAWLTSGRYYIAREPESFPGVERLRCCICEHQFESEDMSHCPAYAGPICSLCCSLDSRCEDQCKPGARLVDQIAGLLGAVFPRQWVTSMHSSLGHFIGLLFLTSLLIMGLLALVYFQITLDVGVDRSSVASALVNVFFMLLIISGVIAWMFALAHDSRRVAQEESRHQTALLTAEVEAHEQTDRKLQEAKEHAEAANNAKSRYLTGISHELRSPLNAIMGYAQLLEMDSDVPPKRQNALRVIRRSSEHLADLIEGLLDISRIEAGRLDLSKNDVALKALLDQIVNMFRVQASAKGIELIYEQLTPLPDTVRTDEKRLRQILINLISNAIKYTAEGHVRFSVRYRNQVAEFTVEDSGVGIAESDIERIFRPFERIRKPGQQHIAGTGLGLTITQLLTDILGGDLNVSSRPGQGSTFKLSIMLSRVDSALYSLPPERTVVGYEGPERALFVVDDEPTHRSLLHDTLSPLGFHIVQAKDGETCLEMLDSMNTQPNVFLLDVSMPGMNGWDLAAEIRSRMKDAVIFLISANAHESVPDHLKRPPHNAYLVKPIQLAQLLELLAEHAGLQLTHEDAARQISHAVSEQKNPPPQSGIILDEQVRGELLRLANIGYLKGIRARLQDLESSTIDPGLLKELTDLADRMDFNAITQRLEAQR